MWGLYEEFSNGLDELAKEDWISFRYLVALEILQSNLPSWRGRHLSYVPQGNQGRHTAKLAWYFLLQAEMDD